MRTRRDKRQISNSIQSIDLQYNSELKAKIREVSGKEEKLGKILREFTPSFPELSRMFKRTICLFGSTYLCEKLFSTLNFNESKCRSRLTDGHLQAILRVSTASNLQPNVTWLCERKHCKVRYLASRSRPEKPSSVEQLMSFNFPFIFRIIHVQKKVEG